MWPFSSSAPSVDRRSMEARRLAEQRTQDLQDAAYSRGRADAKLEARLTGVETGLKELGEVSDRHGRHLEAVNGSITLTANNISALSEKFEVVRAEQLRRDSVNEALIAAGKSSGVKSLERWQRIGIALMALFAGASLALGIIQALG